MRTINYYHEGEDQFQVKFYLFILFLFGIFLIFLFSIQIDLTFPFTIMKIEDGSYQAYLSDEQIDKIKETGIFYTNQKKYHYTRQLVPDSQVAYENTIFTLVTFQLTEECHEPIISGRILISRNTIFDRIVNLWKEEL